MARLLVLQLCLLLEAGESSQRLLWEAAQVSKLHDNVLFSDDMLLTQIILYYVMLCYVRLCSAMLYYITMHLIITFSLSVSLSI